MIYILNYILAQRSFRSVWLGLHLFCILEMIVIDWNYTYYTHTTNDGLVSVIYGVIMIIFAILIFSSYYVKILYYSPVDVKDNAATRKSTLNNTSVNDFTCSFISLTSASIWIKQNKWWKWIMVRIMLMRLYLGDSFAVTSNIGSDSLEIC